MSEHSTNDELWHDKGRRVRQRMITHDGITLSLTEWAKRIGVNKKTLHVRLKLWRNVGLALTSPSGFHGKCAK